MTAFVRVFCIALCLIEAPLAAAAAAPWPRDRQTQDSVATPAAQDPSLAELRAGLEAARGAQENGDPAAASSSIIRTIDTALALLEEREDTPFLNLLGELGHFAQLAGELHTAQRVCLAVIPALERTLPQDHSKLLEWRGNLAATMSALGDLAGARALQEAVVAGFERTVAEDDPNLLRARAYLGQTLRLLGDLAAARVLQEALLASYERTHPEDHPQLLGARGALAATLRELGDLAGARSLQEAVLAGFERTLPPDHPRILGARTNLAATLASLGDLANARVLEEAVLAARERTLPEGHAELLRARHNLAATLFVLGDLAGAQALQGAVLAAREQSLPEDHPEVLSARGNLAASRLALGDLAGARVLQEALVQSYERTLPEGHPNLLWARGSLASTLRFLGELEGARVLQESVLALREQSLPQDHPDLLGARGDLAATMLELGDFARARSLQEAVLAGHGRTLPEDHPDRLWARENLVRTLASLSARAQRERGKESRTPEQEELRQKIAELTTSISSSLTRAAHAAVLSGSAREAEERSGQADRGFTLALSLALGSGALGAFEELTEGAFLASETTRGAALAVSELARGALDAAQYEALRAELRRASADLASLAQAGAGAQEFHRARTRREQVERGLSALALEAGGGAAALLEFDVEALAPRLGERAAAVAFRSYTRWEPGFAEAQDGAGPARQRDTRERSLCAFVLSGVGEGSAARLELVDLGPLDAIDAAVRGWRQAIAVGIERGIGIDPAEGDAARAAGVFLAQAVWTPLVPYLADAERVLVVLDDVLHLVPLDALPWGEGEGLIGQHWRIETRTALWEVLAARPPAAPGGALVALGGASFNSGPQGVSDAELASLEDEQAPVQGLALARILRGGAWERGFAPLTYTGPEARGLAALFEEVHEEAGRTLLLERRRASRVALEEAAPKARWLHVATHGWFAPESIRSWSDRDPSEESAHTSLRAEAHEVVRGMSPMLLCGLALAGANLPADSVGRVPGLMTAEELSTLDLSNCELAVLSACDTNVGERRAGQGVASLQKALHMAGARSVITSLWKVPDEATSELMLDFYRRLWVEQKPKHQALLEAKLRLRQATDERGHPLYSVRDWAAWVLTGDPN